MSPPAPTILVVETVRAHGEALAEQLLADGYRVELARTCEHARILARASRPALVVLGSLDAPRGAVGLLQEIRSCDRDGDWDPELGAIVLGGVPRESDLLRAFEVGADDFMWRPARYLELRARVRAILARLERSRERPAVLEVGPLVVDSRSRSVTLHGAPVALRRLEFDLLAHLAAEPERVYAKPELLRAVWGYRCGGSTRTLDSHASRLRRKLGSRGESWVINERAVGYRLR